MSKEAVVGGLKVALERGASLQDAMQSFYNSGYSKEDIEAAAREVQSLVMQTPQQAVQQIPQQVSPQTYNHQQPAQKSLPSVIQQKKELKPTQPLPTPKSITFNEKIPPVSSPSSRNIPLKPGDIGPPPSLAQPSQLQYPAQIQAPEVKQNVSLYSSEKPKKKFDAVTITLIIVLILLLGLLASVFVFKSQVVQLINKII